MSPECSPCSLDFGHATRNRVDQCGRPRLGSELAARELASSGRPVGAIRLCASLGGDGCVCSVLDSHSVVASNGKSSKPAWQGFLGFLRVDLGGRRIVRKITIVPRSSCVISSWLQYF